MKKIYILLMHTNTIPSKIVKFFTRYEYSHVAISMDNSCYTTYSFGRRKVHSILNGGLSIQKKDGEFFTYFDKTVCRIYELDITDRQYKKLKRKIKKMEERQDIYKYDFVGLVPRFFKLPISFKNKYVCSYFVAELLKQAKIYEFNKPTCLVNPKDFLNIEEMREVYTGQYMLYSV